ncbi:MAG: hypothetical protein D3910_16080, partial [Candidatus Electrothrix sp. ATG2]|nr:hypothetical protein [Candidatus Electrothrix sp. ATG2]
MVSKTDEQALEATIEKALTGTCREEQASLTDSSQVAEQGTSYRTGQGFYQSSSKDFNPKYALDEHHFWNFLETTQPQELSKLQRA